MEEEHHTTAAATLYSVAYRSQISLIRIADNKANLVIVLNMMIISTLIAVSGYGILSNKMEQDSVNIVIPISLILISCLTSAIFAIQAAKPKLIRPKALDLKKDKSSLLFFGAISDFSQEEYLRQMEKLVASEKDIYENMNIDLYNQGLILSRKYQLLNRAYRIFMFGFIVSVWVFLIFLIA